MAGRVAERAKDLFRRGMDAYWAMRRRRPWFDHAVRAAERYTDQDGSRLAASVTYFGFLSFFPLIALAFAVVGYVAEFSPDARDYLETAIGDLLPGLAAELPIDQVAQARTGASVVGLLGLLYTGLGAVGQLRAALHRIWLKNPSEGPNVVLAKLQDLAVMVVLGTALLASVALTSVSQAATRWVLAWVELDGSVAAVAATRLLAVAIAVAADTLIFLVLFSRLSGTRRPWRMLWRGALLAAAAFEVLKAAGALLIASTLNNPVYASFAVLVGLLVWMNIVLRAVLFAAAWTATWLPVPPPYQGAVPLDLPVGLVPGAPGRSAVRPADGARAAAVLPARPTAEGRARSRVLTRRWLLRRRLRALAPAAGAAAAGAALWAVFRILRARRGGEAYRG
ncbi:MULTISPECIES: YihY/virulence factor BrkB family protein [Nocardiopsis]|uniref:YihY/virulence factor BrkB family protein n=1 Tax=Nocardiopsis TaxID=2013 RepID=UPI00034749DF|nr:MULTISPECIES: YihY/virulence factor BrkB family protein [Nocardiopsis]